MFFCRCESASTIRGLSGVICFWTLEASISQHPVVSIFPTDIEKVALSRLKVTAPWRTARSGLPRNVIDFNRHAGVWTIGGLPHHLVKDIRCVFQTHRKKQGHDSLSDSQSENQVESEYC